MQISVLRQCRDLIGTSNMLQISFQDDAVILLVPEIKCKYFFYPNAVNLLMRAIYYSIC